MIGILAIQGDYEAHARMLVQLKAPYCFVRSSLELQSCQALIIPGGESTTLLKFLENSDLLDAMLTFARENKPVFGTCAGAILLAQKVLNPSQKSLELIDITIERNGYGRQVESTIAMGETSLCKEKVEMVFIRAPRIVNVGPQVEVIATYKNDPVFVRQNNCLAATFHPELSESLMWHHYFITLRVENFT